MYFKKKKPGVIKKSAKKTSSVIYLFHDAMWLITLFALGFLTLSFLSFTMSDPSWSRSTTSSTRIHNLCGTIGAYLSDIFYYMMGLSAWWLLVAVAIWLFKGFKTLSVHNNTLPSYHKFLGGLGLILLITSSAVLEYQLWSLDFRDILPYGAGGLLGNTLAPQLNNALGTTGSTLILFIFLMIGFSLLTQVSWLVMIEKIGLQLEWLWNKIKRKPTSKSTQEERTSRRMIQKVKQINANPVSDDIPTLSKRTPKKTEPTQPIQENLNFHPEEIQTLPASEPSLKMPDLNLLIIPKDNSKKTIDPNVLQANAERIEAKLGEFGIQATVVSATHGPVITRYEIEPAQGIKGNQIVNLSKDLARSLSLQSIRIVETIAGKTTMGIEIPNEHRKDVLLHSILSSGVFQSSKSKLTIALGDDIAGTPVLADLAKMPHLLVAGTTGSGKSVAINAMIVSMLYKATPQDVRMIMIDPKMLELSVYNDIPHLLTPVITDMKLASMALSWCVNEMEKRYRLLSHVNVRNIAGFNQKIEESATQNITIPNPFSLNPDEPEALEAMPYIVIIIDELADLMMVEGKKVEQQIARLAQKARAAGIHLILATQRPSVDVITGLIKANIPTRISFQVSSKIDSRTILDQMGAENLLGKGDMLFLPPGTGEPTRLHGAFVSDTEVLNIASYLRRNAPTQYIDAILSEDAQNNPPGSSQSTLGHGEQDALFDDAVQFVLETRKTSISSLQRHLHIGYNRSANLMEAMEKAGIVSAPELGGSRQILVNNPS